MKPEHRASGNINGEGYPGTPDWFSGQLIADDDIDQGVINLNQFQGPGYSRRSVRRGRNRSRS
jgi:hypothetical protein